MFIILNKETTPFIFGFLDLYTSRVVQVHDEHYLPPGLEPKVVSTSVSTPPETLLKHNVFTLIFAIINYTQQQSLYLSL